MIIEKRKKKLNLIEEDFMVRVIMKKMKIKMSLKKLDLRLIKIRK